MLSGKKGLLIRAILGGFILFTLFGNDSIHDRVFGEEPSLIINPTALVQLCKYHNLRHFVAGTKMLQLEADGWDDAMVVYDLDGSNRVELGKGYDVSLSPDGTLVSYIGKSGSIEVINTDGTNRKILTTPWENGIEREPIWSPDGSYLSFYRSTDGLGDDDALFIIRPDGSNLVRVPGKPGSFMVSSDHVLWLSSNTLVFEAHVADDEKPYLYQLSVDGQNLSIKEITIGESLWYPSFWSHFSRDSYWYFDLYSLTDDGMFFSFHLSTHGEAIREIAYSVEQNIFRDITNECKRE